MSKETDHETILAFIKMGLSLSLSFADMAATLSNAGYEVPTYEEVEARLQEVKDLPDFEEE